jgi:ABC-2 type transport system permease protein
MQPSAETLAPLPPLTRARRPLLSPLGVLFWLTFRQYARGRRLLLVALLFALPVGLALLVRSLPHPPEPIELEFALVFNLIPHALAPLTALLFASGMIQDEVEEQTLTYLLLRPLPRWALYLTKLLATFLTTTLLTVAGVAALYLTIYWGTAELWDDILPVRLPQVVAIVALGQGVYCSLFGALMLMTRRSLLGGVVYIVAVEGILANIDFLVRRLTVIYHSRVLVLRWLDLPARTMEEWRNDWEIDLARAPEIGSCVWTLLGAAAVIALLSAWRFSRREFPQKTPEGN